MVLSKYFDWGGDEAAVRRFGWTRAQVSSGLILVFLIALGGPIVGGLIPRFGLRALATAGLVLLGIAVALVGLTGPRIWSVRCTLQLVQ